MVYVNGVEKSTGTYIYSDSFLLPYNPITQIIYAVDVIYVVCVSLYAKHNLSSFLDQVSLHFNRAADLQYERRKKKKKK